MLLLSKQGKLGALHLPLPLHDNVLIQEHHPHIIPLLQKVLPRRMELGSTRSGTWREAATGADSTWLVDGVVDLIDPIDP